MTKQKRNQLPQRASQKQNSKKAPPANNRRPRQQTAKKHTPSAKVDTTTWLLSYDKGLVQWGEEEFATCFPQAKFSRISDSELLLPQRVNPEKLKTAHALYRRLLYPVTRPRALLGHENLENLLKAVDETSQLPDGTKMKGFRVSAAGSDSSVLIRLKQIISERLHLVEDSENGELLIRLRRSKASPGWEVLIRTTPKPLSVRSWRTHNTPGALNGSVAAVLVRATRPTPEDTVIDLTCGSGTLLIERAAYGPTKKLIGIDISLNALRNASEHLENAGTTKAELMQADICSPIPQEARSFSVIMANLPWGERVGTRKDNSLISQEICHRLQELAAPGARAVLLTQDHQVLRKALQTKLPYWNIKSEYKLEQRGFTPTLFILQNLEKK